MTSTDRLPRALRSSTVTPISPPAVPLRHDMPFGHVIRSARERGLAGRA